MKPAFIENNPIMQVMFASFIRWAFDDADMIAQFERDTGMKRLPAPRNGLEAMVDDATGAHKAYAEAFFAWAVKQWGDEDDPEYQQSLIDDSERVVVPAGNLQQP